MDIESLWYEAFPYLYGVGGVVACCVSPGSTLLKISGALLIVAAITVIRMRWVYRRALFVQMPTAVKVATDGIHATGEPD